MQNIMLIDISTIMATVVTIVCMLRMNITNDVASDWVMTLTAIETMLTISADVT